MQKLLRQIKHELKMAKHCELTQMKRHRVGVWGEE